PFQDRAPEPSQARDVGVEVRRVKAEVLEPVVRHRVAVPELLTATRARDVDGHAIILAHAADEPVAEDPRLVGHDLEVEGLHVPVRGLPGIGGLQMEVVDPECHRNLQVRSSNRGQTRGRPPSFTGRPAWITSIAWPSAAMSTAGSPDTDIRSATSPDRIAPVS